MWSVHLENCLKCQWLQWDAGGNWILKGNSRDNCKLWFTKSQMQKLIRLNSGKKLKMSREGLSITLLYSPFMFLDAGVLLLLSHWRCLSNGPLMVGSLNLTKVFGTEPFLLDRNKIRSDYMLVGGAICVSESSVGAHWVEVLLGLEWGWGDFLLHTSKYKWTWPTFHFLGGWICWSNFLSFEWSFVFGLIFSSFLLVISLAKVQPSFNYFPLAVSHRLWTGK